MALPSVYGEESAEALRRRADVLLDEMMLGGVDTASAGPQPGSYTGNGAEHGPSYDTGHGTGHWSESAEIRPEYDGSGHGPNGAGGEFDAHSSTHAASQPGSQEANGYHTAPAAAGARLVSAEARYAQFADSPRPAPQSVEQSAAPPQPRPEDWPPERTAADFAFTAASAAAVSGAMSGAGSSGGAQPAVNSAVRRQSPSLASTMSVGVRGANRSNLLPRNNEIDVNAAQQEINDLMAALGKALPPGNEAVERSRHLLNKAQTLLQSDPTRTAEVDYYLQQVRRIVQRARQTQQWSSLYRRRLNLYLGAWLLLSALVISAAALYAAPLADWINQTVDLPDWWMVVHQGPLLLACAFAGSMGASLSALWHVQRHAAREYGYFDRKYGLRGLLLPLLGWLLGLLLAAVWAGVYLVVGLDPVLYAWAIAAPAVLAFLIGFGQQWLYGAR